LPSPIENIIDEVRQAARKNAVNILDAIVNALAGKPFMPEASAA
jgi:hypothetical protein